MSPPYLLCLIQGCFSGDMSFFVVSDSGLIFRRHVLICFVWFRVVFQETCPNLFCLIHGCFSGDMSLSPEKQPWIRQNKLGHVSWKTTLNQTQQIRTCLLKNNPESDTTNKDMSPEKQRLFFRRHVLICFVWFRVVFQETCPYLLCLIQGCFSGDMSLFVLSDSGLFFRKHVLICCVWFRDVFQETCHQTKQIRICLLKNNPESEKTNKDMSPEKQSWIRHNK
jgi:hypothetical protein